MATRDHPIQTLLRQALSLRAETDYAATVTLVRSDTELRSGGVWALAFAILIASVGLNVNSTAVVIGAMLISPLMGPIIGAGLALGTDDLDLLRQSVRNLLVSAVIGLVTSTLYFAISPLADAQSELLARTHPTLYDVLIALFGGGAGIVAVSRKANKSTVVPGVAIATALMPPLCTAGFGLAHLDWRIFLGAMNLFLINALFICLATLGFVRAMRFERVVSTDNGPATARAHLIVGLLTLALLLPSAYAAWNVVQETRFRGASRRFVAENLTFEDRSLLNVSLHYGRDSSSISATLIGEPVSSTLVDSLNRRLRDYGLARTRLLLRQPFEKQLSPEQVSTLIREGLQKSGDARVDQSGEIAQAAEARQALAEQAEAARRRALEPPIRALSKELASLFPALTSFGIGHQVSVTDTATSDPQVVAVVATWRRLPTKSEQSRVRAWLALRLKTDSIVVTNAVDH